MTTTTCDRGSASADYSADYWAGVGCELVQPAWLAYIGLPLLVVLGGLTATVLLVRRQLAATRHARDAERLSPPVNEFGRAVLEAVDRAHNTTGLDPYWDSQEWHGLGLIEAAHERLVMEIARPDACREVIRGSHDVAAAWAACVQRSRELETGGEQLPGIAVAHGLDAACTPLWDDVRRAGEVLAHWDGLGPIPDFDPWPHPHVQPAGRNATDRHREARYSWLTYYADEFERVAVKHA